MLLTLGTQWARTGKAWIVIARQLNSHPCQAPPPPHSSAPPEPQRRSKNGDHTKETGKRDVGRKIIVPLPF